jgi:hypothetical protein
LMQCNCAPAPEHSGYRLPARSHNDLSATIAHYCNFGLTASHRRPPEPSGAALSQASGRTGAA